MNADNEDQKLDAMLSRWTNESGSSERISDLHDRIVISLMELRDAQHDPTEPAASLSADAAGNAQGPALACTAHKSGAVRLTVQTQNDRPPARRNHWMSSLVVGAVVASLLAITLLPGGDLQHVSPAVELPPDYAWLHHDQLKNKAVLLSEMESLFDQKVAWLAETDDRMNFRLAESESNSNGGTASNHLAVRILVQRRQPGTSVWQLALSMDVMSRSEELIHVVPQGADGSELTLWTYRLPDGSIAVDSSVQIAGNVPFRAEASGLHQNDKPMQVATVHNKDADYRVFQTVTVLNGKVI